MKGFNLSGLILLFCVVTIVFCAPSWAADEIKIGIIGPMKFIYGKSQWNGAVMAAEEINNAGGIKVGRKHMKIELVKADSNELFSTVTAVNAMEKLLLRDKVDFVIGGISTEATLAMQDVAMDNKTIFYSAGAAHPELCDRVVRDYNRYKYFFRGTPFNSNYLIKTNFLIIRSVAAAMNQKLNIGQFKVGILAEKAMWADPMVSEAEKVLPKMGMEIVGTWRISGYTKDISSELADIQSKGCHILMTLINGPAGVVLGRQYGELKIPTVITGIVTQASTLKWMDATQGQGNYIMTTSNYTEDVEYNELTKPFVSTYIEKYGDVPTFTADTYAIIKYVIKQSVEDVSSIDPEKVIPYLESGITKIPAGVGANEKDEMGRHRHDLKWGPGYTTGIAAQWQNGKFVAVWPHFKWRSPYWDFAVEPSEESNEMSYKGLQPFIIPPWLVEAYSKK